MRVMAIAIVVGLLVFGAAIPASAACSAQDISSGNCVEATNDGSTITLTGTDTSTTPGTSNGSSKNTSTTPSSAPTPVPTNPSDDDTAGYFHCTNKNDCKTQVEVDPPTVVTLNDIVDFQPGKGVLKMEPNGWAVVGLPANFYSTATQHVIAGELLGADAEVRFTPTSWHWDYGDGSTLTSTSGGASWATRHLDEFSATTTSHVYDDEGTITVFLAIDFAAEYRFAGGEWTPIAGVVTARTTPVTVIADDASTVLVGAACSAGRSAPGC